MPDTNAQYRAVIAQAREIFLAKAADYGSSWRVLRLPSLTDQLFIKAKRIRTLEETGENRVGDSIAGEYFALVNYSVIAQLLGRYQAEGRDPFTTDAPGLDELAAAYDSATAATFDLFQAKNHDYGEAWREMRLQSYTDLILSKLLRIKQIEANAGQTQVSEGVQANYQDILNYAVFALIRLGEEAQAKD